MENMMHNECNDDRQHLWQHSLPPSDLEPYANWESGIRISQQLLNSDHPAHARDHMPCIPELAEKTQGITTIHYYFIGSVLCLIVYVS